jgi:uncharacterized DUF497 family protein
MPDNPFVSCEGFDWDEGNVDKNWKDHGVAFWEAEEVFFNRPLILQPDPAHSLKEDRYYVLGKTNADRLLFVVFTIRKNLIRVISVRDMSRKERRIYEQKQKENPDV